MSRINIQPIGNFISDIRGINAAAKEGPVFLTQEGYGTLVTMTIADYERITDPLENLLDETDRYCETNPIRLDGRKMFSDIRNRRHAERAVSS